MRVVFAAVLLLATAAATPAYRYRLDESGSNVSARVAFFGLASKTAHFPKVSGGIALSPDRLEEIDLYVTLDARALTAGDSVTLGRLRGEKFFDVAHYPVVQFSGQHMTMTGPVTATVTGEITARGVTRPAVLAVSFAHPPASATGREPINLSARTVIDRRAFGMTAYKVIVGRNVTITINARMVPG